MSPSSAGRSNDVPRVFVANVEEDPQHSATHWIKVAAETDGTFTVTNSRNGFSKTYDLP